ncbi:BQ2448_6134 [Microbotryum intermedium]|uniref:BQ2448_6134 protein n=1 Tax=Microbotryum intermedium TaxID=269621 RepID=A0A238FP78_9BASI|nr:BQ2448_6134 [Microbotryum intermedium]
MPLYISMDSPLLSVAAKGINGASKAKYDPTKSETAHQVGKSEVSSSTHITSVNYQEMVSVAGVEVLNQTVQVMTSAPRGKTLEEVYQSDVPWAGTFGLGRSDSGSSNSTPSYLENLIRMNAIDRHVCGISITNEGGFLDFGFLDRRAYTGDVLWVEVDSEYMENYWTIQMDGVGLNSALIPNTGGRIQFSPEHRFSFISKSLGERWFANISHDVDPTLNVYTLPCELKNTDTIGFAVNGRIFSVPILTLVLSASPLNSSMCLTAIRRVDDSQFLDDKLIVMGAIQMRSYYTILSYEKEHQGLALGLAQASGVRLGGNPN